jgi:hypothetical protein
LYNCHKFEGRGKKEEGRRKKEEGRRKKAKLEFFCLSISPGNEFPGS